jgi:hypothetical protein
VLGDDELDELLAPLVALSDGLQLVGVTNRTRLHAALHGYTYGQVEQAIGMLTRQLRAGAPIRSPVGLLVRLAEQHDPTYFRSAIASSTPTANPLPTPMACADDLVLTPEQRARAHAEIAASFAPLPPAVREQLLADVDGLNRLRLAVFAETTGSVNG